MNFKLNKKCTMNNLMNRNDMKLYSKKFEKLVGPHN